MNFSIFVFLFSLLDLTCLEGSDRMREFIVIHITEYLPFRELLHTRKRQKETIHRLQDVLGNTLLSCEIELTGPEITACSQVSSFLSSAITEDMFGIQLPARQTSGSFAVPVSIEVDNSFSPSHTLVQIFCRDHKGLVYDMMRTLKDYNIQV